MKRLFLLLLTLSTAAALSCAAGAAELGTVRNSDYPGDVEAQAQMLKELGLFKGTGEGFELEKPMTRAEAAIMLTRLLGAEAEAKAENNSHPFQDVPEWASPYVGWLYQNGLAKGMSGTAYGSKRNVTCRQFCLFLTRATYNPEERAAFEQYNRQHDVNIFDTILIAQEEEIAACDSAGFLRADAVALSVRLLGMFFHSGIGIDEDKNFISNGTVAQELIDRGVFTKETFKEAAWDVLDRSYISCPKDGPNSDNDPDYVLSCNIMGVSVVQGDDPTLRFVSSMYKADKASRLYASRDGDTSLYLVDKETLELTEIGSGWDVDGFTYIASFGNTDYFFLNGESRDLLAVTGTEGRRFNIRSAVTSVDKNEDGSYSIDCYGGVCTLDADGVHMDEAPTGNSRLIHSAEDFDVYQDVTPERTILSVTGRDGALLGSYTIVNDYSMDQSDPYYEYYAPRVQHVKNNVLWGGAGYYQVTDGKLIQRIARPVYDFATVWSDNSMVVVTHEPGVRVTYTADRGAMADFTGNELVRITPNGLESTILPAPEDGEKGPFGKLMLDKVTAAANDRIDFTVLIPTWTARVGTFTCVLEGGKIKVTGQDNSITHIWGEDASQKEEAWLNSLLE